MASQLLTAVQKGSIVFLIGSSGGTPYTTFMSSILQPVTIQSLTIITGVIVNTSNSLGLTSNYFFNGYVGTFTTLNADVRFN